MSKITKGSQIISKMINNNQNWPKSEKDLKNQPFSAENLKKLPIPPSMKFSKFRMTSKKVSKIAEKRWQSPYQVASKMMKAAIEVFEKLAGFSRKFDFSINFIPKTPKNSRKMAIFGHF